MNRNERLVQGAAMTLAGATADLAQSLMLEVALCRDVDVVLGEYIKAFVKPEKLMEHGSLVGCSIEESRQAVMRRAESARPWVEAADARISLDAVAGAYVPKSVKALQAAASDVVLLCLVNGHENVTAAVAESAELDPNDPYVAAALDTIPALYGEMKKDIDAMVAEHTVGDPEEEEEEEEEDPLIFSGGEEIFGVMAALERWLAEEAKGGE